MALRDFAVGAARLNATVWKEIVRAVDPEPSSQQRPPRHAATAAKISEPAPASVADEPEAADEQAIPEAAPGTMLVPVDTWTRILDQLGHLHQAGQELAEARERAARAETEAAFLREQLADARAQAKKTPKRSAAPVTPKKAVAALANDDQVASADAVVQGSPGASGTEGATARMHAAREAAWSSVTKARARIRNRRTT
jgi:hypothetical protein